jgi:hypothetical protein
MNRTRPCLCLIFVGVLLAACATGHMKENDPTPDYWPTKGWRSSTPERQGLDSEKLAEALDFARR